MQENEQIKLADESELSNVIIGLSGKKQSGKDTVAMHLTEEYGFVRYAFADPIKKACQVIFGFTDAQCWGDEKEIVDSYWNITPRKVFQIFGTELFQYEFPKYAQELADIGRMFWVYVFARWYEQQLAINPDIKVVITDVRFPFEAKMITSLGGTIIKISRDGAPTNDHHSSETDMDQIEYSHTIENNGSIGLLHKQIDDIVGLVF